MGIIQYTLAQINERLGLAGTAVQPAALSAETTARSQADTALENKIGVLTGLSTAAKGSLVAAINELDPPPDVLVHTGDVVHNGRQDEYARAAAILAQARAPVHVLAGNKDDRANLREAFFARCCLAPDFGFVHYVDFIVHNRLGLSDADLCGSHTSPEVNNALRKGTE